MNANFDEKIGLAKCSESQAIGNYLKNISVIFLIMFAELKRCITFVSTKTNKTKKDMTTETMKLRTEKELIKMGCSVNEAKSLIEKFWNQVDYINTAKGKALYMTA